MKCGLILCGLCVLLSILITGGSAAAVDISPDVLYVDMPVTITYSGLQDDDWIGMAFRPTYVPETPEFTGIIAELSMPFNLSDFYTVSIDGNYTFDSFDFFSDSYAVNSLSKGIFYFDLIKKNATPGESTTVSYILDGFKESGDESGVITLYPDFNPRQGVLSISVWIEDDDWSKDIPYLWNMAAPSAEAESVTVESGKTTTGNFTLSHLHNGLSYCYANITIDDRSVGEFEVGGIRFYDGFTGGYVSYPYFTNLYISASPNLTGPIDEIPVVQLTYGGISPGSTLINVTELELYDANGTRYPTVQDYPGLLTVTDPPVQKPVITNLNPAGCQQNSHSGPFPVIITGTGFDTVSGTNNVTVDGSVVPYFVDSPTRINATFPEIVDNTLGSHPVIVKGISGSSAPNNFVVSGKGFTIDASSDEIGWINPSGVFSVDPGTPLSFTFKPTSGTRIKNLTVNGVEQPTESPFVIPSVDKDYTIRLNNEPLPGVIIAAFTVESDDGYTVTFNDKSWGEPNQWKWDFGDGSVGTGNPVSHSYSTPGSYSVSLWVRSDLSQSQVVIGDIVIPMPGEVGLLTFGP